jgi:hypothetical protein
MNGKQAKAIRKALAIKKPTPLEGGGVFEHEGKLYFRQAKNPLMNLYRSIKRRYKRGEFRHARPTN